MATRNFGNFETAVRKGQKAKIALAGVSGSGKTFSSLLIAKTLTDNGKVLVVDTENNSSTLYADEFEGWSYSVFNWQPPYDPRHLTAGLKEWGDQFDCIIIDSFSAYWQDVGGLLSIVEQASGPGKGGNFAGWKTGTPIQNELVQTILRLPCHCILSMRAKSDVSMDKDDKGKTKVVKHGLTAVQRESIVYDVSIFAMLDLSSHALMIEKSRCSALADRTFQAHSGTVEFATTLRDWLNGAEAEEADRLMNAEITDSLDRAAQETAAAERASSTIPPEEADLLTRMFNHISDENDRNAAKMDFVKKFGKPNELTMDKLDEATLYINDLLGV